MNAEILTILGTGIGTAIGIAGFIYTIIRNFREDFDKKFDAMDKRWVETNKRMDGVYHILLKRIKDE